MRATINDADYIISVTLITDEQLEAFKPLFKAIKAFKPYRTKINGLDWNHNANWPTGEYCCREDLGEKTIEELYGDLGVEFDENFVPHSDGNIHTIKSISVATIEKKIL